MLARFDAPAAWKTALTARTVGSTHGIFRKERLVSIADMHRNAGKWTGSFPTGIVHSPRNTFRHSGLLICSANQRDRRMTCCLCSAHI